MSTTTERRLIAELEHHAATINQLLDVLQIALANARTRALERKLLSEIEFHTDNLARVWRDRDAAQRALAEREGKQKQASNGAALDRALAELLEDTDAAG